MYFFSLYCNPPPDFTKNHLGDGPPYFNTPTIQYSVAHHQQQPSSQRNPPPAILSIQEGQCFVKTVPGCNIAGINTLACWNSKDLKNYYDRDRENPTSLRPNPPFLQELGLHFQWSAYRVQSHQQVCSTNVRLHTK